MQVLQIRNGWPRGLDYSFSSFTAESATALSHQQLTGITDICSRRTADGTLREDVDDREEEGLSLCSTITHLG